MRIASCLGSLEVCSPFGLGRRKLTFVGDFRDPNAEIQWDSIDNGLYRLDHNTLQVCLIAHALDGPITD